METKKFKAKPQIETKPEGLWKVIYPSGLEEKGHSKFIAEERAKRLNERMNNNEQ